MKIGEFSTFAAVTVNKIAPANAKNTATKRLRCFGS